MKKYKSIIFDCDGVILNSNEIKTASFKKILVQFNRNAVNEFLNYHKNNGGVSRYIKIEYFLTSILPKYSIIRCSFSLFTLLLYPTASSSFYSHS